MPCKCAEKMLILAINVSTALIISEAFSAFALQFTVQISKNFEHPVLCTFGANAVKNPHYWDHDVDKTLHFSIYFHIFSQNLISQDCLCSKIFFLVIYHFMALVWSTEALIPLLR